MAQLTPPLPAGSVQCWGARAIGHFDHRRKQPIPAIFAIRAEKVRAQLPSLRHQPRPANLYLPYLAPVRDTLPSVVAAAMAMRPRRQML